jgi:threonine aldolase
MQYIDLRSDTVTHPTEEMRRAMAAAEVGDDVYRGDPTVNALESLAAEMTGKEAALFVPSGTFGNQVALLTHCKRGDEVILGEECHIVQHEVGASAVIAGVQLRPIPAPDGCLDPIEVRARIRPADIHAPETGLICMENAHSNGKVVPIAAMKAVYDLAHGLGLPVHLDGARLFNAATHLGVEAGEIVQYCDTVMFCLSKGLCAPVGSMVAGDGEWIERARKNRKLMGGGMRQAGILAAAGLIALNDMTKRLGEDHTRARRLAGALASAPGIAVNMDALDINMVFLHLDTDLSSEAITDYCREHGLLVYPPEDSHMRLVTHYWIDDADADRAVEVLRQVAEA